MKLEVSARRFGYLQLFLAGGMIIGLVLSIQPIQASSSATIVQESSLPWLVKGAFADYFWTGVGNGPGFVLQNGTILLNVPPGQHSSLGNSTLDWVVLNRTGSLAWLEISFKTVGCAWSFEEYNRNEGCTNFAFSSTIQAEVNVTSRETYVGGVSQGILNFWAPPLLHGGVTISGTAFVNGTPFDVTAGVSSLEKVDSFAGFPQAGVNVSGAYDKGPFEFYQLTPTTFGTGKVSMVAWLKATSVGNVTYIPNDAPSGVYDYYNGLAYVMSLPEYPVPQTVCTIENDLPTNCGYTPYSTTLGTFFRSTGGFVALQATNIQLGPETAGNSTTSGQSGCFVCAPEYPWNYVTVGFIVVIVASLSVMYAVRCRGRHLRSLKKSR